jgi:hypothetical protein
MHGPLIGLIRGARPHVRKGSGPRGRAVGLPSRDSMEAVRLWGADMALQRADMAVQRADVVLQRADVALLGGVQSSAGKLAEAAAPRRPAAGMVPGGDPSCAAAGLGSLAGLYGRRPERGPCAGPGRQGRGAACGGRAGGRGELRRGGHGEAGGGRPLCHSPRCAHPCSLLSPPSSRSRRRATSLSFASVRPPLLSLVSPLFSRPCLSIACTCCVSIPTPKA